MMKVDEGEISYYSRREISKADFDDLNISLDYGALREARLAYGYDDESDSYVISFSTPGETLTLSLSEYIYKYFNI